MTGPDCRGRSPTPAADEPFPQNGKPLTNEFPEDAIDATQSGVTLIEHAIKSGQLQADALAVPYENLAAMYEAKGETESHSHMSVGRFGFEC